MEFDHLVAVEPVRAAERVAAQTMQAHEVREEHRACWLVSRALEPRIEPLIEVSEAAAHVVAVRSAERLEIRIPIVTVERRIGTDLDGLGHVCPSSAFEHGGEAGHERRLGGMTELEV